MRIDKALVEYKFFTTRAKAQQAIDDGIVTYQGRAVTKSSLDITDPKFLQLQGDKMPYVSRGGLKLQKALDVFNIDLTNRIVIDIGSSTGGFTDCALQHGAKHVIAIDTGTNQMDTSLRFDPRITLLEQTDFRDLSSKQLVNVQIAIIDISFLSVTKILQKLSTLPQLDQVICLIKPQFECGKEIADKYKGIVLNRDVHQDLLKKVIQAFADVHLFLQDLTFSPITGGSGNIEYLAYFKKSSDSNNIDISPIVQEAFAKLR